MIIFKAWLVYTINIYSNRNCFENFCSCLRVIHQDKNSKLKNDKCRQRTSLNLIHTGLQKRIGCVTNAQTTVSERTDGGEKWQIVNKPKRYGTVFTLFLLFIRDFKYGQLPYRTLYTFLRTLPAKKNLKSATQKQTQNHV